MSATERPRLDLTCILMVGLWDRGELPIPEADLLYRERPGSGLSEVLVFSLGCRPWGQQRDSQQNNAGTACETLTSHLSLAKITVLSIDS